MSRLVVLSAAEQVATHLREEGTWSGLMPGGDRLAAALGVGRDTVEAALRRLEEAGLLEWFIAQETPVFALFGRRQGLSIAGVGPDKPPAMAEVTRRLLDLGHRRIVLLARKMRRLPQPGAVEQAFLDTLAAHGISPGPYYLPDWEESVEGYYARLESLFQVTPPTALIVDEVPLFVAAQQFLAGRGLRVPEDVSLVCTDYDTSFEWCRPSISHIHWQSRPVVMRILQWANHVSQGKEDLRQSLTPVRFVSGGTIGPAKEGTT